MCEASSCQEKVNVPVKMCEASKDQEKPKPNHMTAAQKEFLIFFMEMHEVLKLGKFKKDFTFKKGVKLWQEATDSLNSIPGAHKTWEKWRKVSHFQSP